MAQEGTTEERNLYTIRIFKERLIKTIQVASLLDYMPRLPAELRETLRHPTMTNIGAARMLIDHLLDGPREVNWCEDFLSALRQSENSQAALYVRQEDIPSPQQEAKVDCCEDLLQVLFPSLLEKLEPKEIASRCRSKKLCSQEDYEVICNSPSSLAGNRELLSRITKKKDWFPVLVSVLHELGNMELIEVLTGMTYEKYIAGVEEERKSQEKTAEYKKSPPDDEGGPSAESRDVTSDSRQHGFSYSDGSTMPDLDVSLPELNLSHSSQNGVKDSDSDVETSDDVSSVPKITLRDYQMEVAEPALKGENVIICLPTGSGKTRVAVYITKQHLDKRKQQKRLAKVIVLVNKVPLVDQHYRSEFNPLLRPRYKVIKISGDSQLKISFTREVQNNDVIICTAQILENFLNRKKDEEDRVRLSDFSLLIIDECHHTQKEAVYNNIMMRYIRQKRMNERNLKMQDDAAVVELPQVLGLTASPGVGEAKDVKKAEQHILRICANLDSKIKVVQKNISQLGNQVKLPSNKVEISEDNKKNPFGDELKKMMTDIETYADLSTTSEHGSQSYEQWVIQTEKTAVKEAVREGKRKQHICAVHLKKYNDALQISDTIRMSDALIHLEKFYSDERKKLSERDIDRGPEEINETDYFLINLFDDHKENLTHLAAKEEYENEKLAKLRKTIMEEFTRNDKARGIIFTKTRQSAAALCQWINDNEKFKEVDIRAHYLIGAGNNSEFTAMTQNEQKKVIDKFKNGDLNLLVATSVAEEGLDIPECNIVIIYGRITNEIAMVQARGRARAENSKLVVVASNSSGAAERHSVNQFREDLMHKAIQKVQQMAPKDFAAKIREFQIQNLNEQKQKKMKKLRKVYQENPSMVNFLCRKCQKKVFSGSNIRVIENMHHVIADPKFKQYFKEGENKTLQEKKLYENQTNIEITCRDCGRTWGNMMVHKGLNLPCLKIRHFVIKYEEEKMTKDTLEIWSDLPIKFPSYSNDEQGQEEEEDYGSDLDD
ncbi:interferon-induced helicase C domain-containing protein 1 isoform X2 [Hyperolius riggenbachi]|uniref:interferon-induced helicase C domain-containing protein 1 isoform X2 n=1 Tax=Hyperolius riggenbachi TaxID=752182 RepID=UPI0035A37E48